jgi:hypothetical protein
MTGLKRHAASDFFSDAGEKKARPNDSPRDGSDKVRDVALHSDDRCYFPLGLFASRITLRTPTSAFVLKHYRYITILNGVNYALLDHCGQIFCGLPSGSIFIYNQKSMI